MYTIYESFMAKRIVVGAKSYDEVIQARPDLKTGIDAYLTAVSRNDLIREDSDETE